MTADTQMTTDYGALARPDSANGASSLSPGHPPGQPPWVSATTKHPRPEGPGFCLARSSSPLFGTDLTCRPEKRKIANDVLTNPGGARAAQHPLCLRSKQSRPGEDSIPFFAGMPPHGIDQESGFTDRKTFRRYCPL